MTGRLRALLLARRPRDRRLHARVLPGAFGGTVAARADSGVDGADPTSAPFRPNPVSLPALMVERYDGGGLRVGRVLDRTSAYTRYFVAYRSGRLTVSGVMNVPT